MRTFSKSRFCILYCPIILILVILWYRFSSQTGQSISVTRRKHLPEHVKPLLTKTKHLAPHLINPINVKRILLITTFRSGSTFLGDLIQQSNLLTYYHYEPLHCLAEDVRIGNEQLVEGQDIVGNLFQCNLESSPRYANYIQRKDRLFMIRKSRFILNLCNASPPSLIQCANIDLLQEMCRRSSVQIMKITRLHLKDALQLKLPAGTKLVYLQRDPRAIYNSRKKCQWCGHTACQNISVLCHERESDLLTLKQLPTNQVTFVRFEDLATQPLEESKRLYHELGLNYTADVEQFIKTHTKDRSKVRNLFSTNRDSSKVISQWQSELSRAEINQLQKSCARVISDAGYDFL